MNLLKKGLVALVVIALAAAGFYFFYYEKNPEQSLIAIQQAFKNRDLATFEKHVDLDKVLGNLFDEVIAEQADGMEFEEKRMVSGFAYLLKKPFIQAAKDNILKEFTKDETKEKVSEEKTAGQVSQNGEIEKTSKKSFFKDFAKKLQPNKMDFKGTGSSKIEGDTAYVDIILYDTKIQKEYTFTAQMIRLNDKTWRLVGLQNVNVYLRDLLGNKLSSKEVSK